ncbi:MAG TPA: DUF5941 domain-containing protein [Streptosporangiaceae bacterium]|nr:DUF5941 domain-containing protein [Streptosporangiaceae bacterium]
MIAGVEAGSDGYRAVIAWASKRGVAANSVSGISLLFGLCAAAWLSGGAVPDTQRGIVAVAVWLVLRFCAARLAEMPGSADSRDSARDHGAGSDWLVLPGYDWGGASTAPASRAGAPWVGWQAGSRSFAWLAAVCGAGAECAIYGGIAAGAEAAGWRNTWPLAIATVALVSVAEVAAACARTAKGERTAAPRESALWRWITAIASPPMAARAMLAIIALAAYGPRVALFTVFMLAALSLGWNLTRIGGQPEISRRDVILACRDDGPLASWAGRLVQGNLTPLPAVLAGLAAIAVLSLIGIRNLQGIIALAPVVVLLLAASGASHPHDGHLDWLVPTLLCLGQYSYLTAFGLARGVAGPVIFAACAMSAVWYTGLAIGQSASTWTSGSLSRPEQISRIIATRRDNLGWDGRICLVALAGMFGITTFGYLGLSVCAGVLIARRAVIGYLIPAVPQPAEQQIPGECQ